MLCNCFSSKKSQRKPSKEVNIIVIYKETIESGVMINMTPLLSLFGKKIDEWILLEKSIIFLQVLSKMLDIGCDKLIVIQEDNVWVHPCIAINIASFLNLRFGLEMTSILKPFMTRSMNRLNEVVIST